MEERVFDRVIHEVFNKNEIEKAIHKVLLRQTGLEFNPVVNIDVENKIVIVKYCEDTEYQKKLALAQYNGGKLSPRGLLMRVLVETFDRGVSDTQMVVLDNGKVMVVAEKGMYAMS